MVRDTSVHGRYKQHIRDQLYEVCASMPKPYRQWSVYTLGLDSLDHSGSYSRSSLVLLWAGLSEPILRSACAIELIHQASLIVDDVIDRSIERRERPVFHLKFGEPAAALLSHYLLNFGQKMLVENFTTESEKVTVITAMLNCVASMAEGEARHLDCGTTSFECYEKYSSAKTGALYGLTGLVISLCYGRPNEQALYQSRFSDIGFLRQIDDDIEDWSQGRRHNFLTSKAFRNDQSKSFGTILGDRVQFEIASENIQQRKLALRDFLEETLNGHAHHAQIIALIKSIVVENDQLSYA